MALIESILIIVVILIILVIIINVFFTKSHYLISGIQPAKTLKHPIHSDKLPDNIGSNFAWCVWVFIEDWNSQYGNVKNVFYQGNTSVSLEAANSSLGEPLTNKLQPNNNFAVALDAYENDLLIGINTFAQSTTSPDDDLLESTNYFTQQNMENKNYKYETYKINNIDLQKWVCIIASVEGRTLDIYLDGKLVRTFVLPNVVPVQKDNIYVGGAGGGVTFGGYLAMLQYFPNSLNPQQAYNIYKDGIGSNLISDFFNKYRLKIQFMEYNTAVGKPLIL